MTEQEIAVEQIVEILRRQPSGDLAYEVAANAMYNLFVRAGWGVGMAGIYRTRRRRDATTAFAGYAGGQRMSGAFCKGGGRQIADVPSWTIWDPVTRRSSRVPRGLLEDTPPRGTVHIGNPGRWGNPNQNAVYVWRTDSLDDYRRWIVGQPRFVDAVKTQLRGRRLACPCSGHRCHGKLLCEIANG